QNWRTSDHAISYSYNYRSLGGAWGPSANDPGQPIVAESTILEPTNLAMMWDSAGPWADCDYASSCGVGGHDLDWYRKQEFTMTSWHAGQNNYLFVDGHVKMRSWQQVTWRMISRGAQVDGNPDRDLSVLTTPQDAHT